MKVALDARQTRQMSAGMKTYARELSERLPRVAPDLDFRIFTQGGNFGWAEQVALPAALRRSGVDLTHFLSLYVPVLPPRPYVLTIHDLIHLRFPEQFKTKVGPYYRTVVRFAARRAARVITDDDRTVADLERFLGVPRARVSVIPLGADDRYLEPIAPHRAQRAYVIYAGNHRKHKDLTTLFAAMRELPIDLDLYLTGHDDLDEPYPRERVRFTGDLSPGELASYYAGALALVHPALCEGFGLPMLEAMAARCPVVACEDAIPGVLRDAALLFPARDAGSLRQAIERIARDEGLRNELVKQGRSKAEVLTWDRCAARTAAVYREIGMGRAA